MDGNPMSRMDQAQRTEAMHTLGVIVEETARAILQMKKEEISDTVQVVGHQFSTVDDKARLMMREFLEQKLGAIPHFLEESEIPRSGISYDQVKYPLYVGDAVEGSTNAKRGLSSSLRTYSQRPIMAGTSLMLLEESVLGSIAAAAFFDWASNRLFTSMRSEHGEFLSFIDERLVNRTEMMAPPRDTQVYVIVPGYSNTNIHQRCAIEEALVRSGLRTTGGTRSSAQDLIELVAGQADAYVDLRRLFDGSTPSRDEVLRAWDVGALLAFLAGLGYVITDEGQESWQSYSFGDSLGLVIARTRELWCKIKRCLENLPFTHSSVPEDHMLVPLRSSHSS